MNGTCPWSEFAPAVMGFCEASRCAWVAQPANAWSSAAFVVGAWLIFRRGMAAFACASLFIGIGSFLFHASNSYLFELVDLVSLFSLGAVMLVTSAERSWDINKLGRILVMGLAFGVPTTATLVDVDYGNSLFGLLMACVTGLEARLFFRRRERHGNWAIRAGACFGVAYGIWWLDYGKVLCSSKGLLTGHAAWHVMTAVSLYFIARYYEMATHTSSNVSQASEVVT